MADETELSRMIIRLLGEGNSYAKMWQQAADESEKGARKIEPHLKRVNEHGHSLALGMRESRHAIHLLGEATGLEKLTGPAMMGLHAFHLFEHSVQAATASIGILGTTLAATGIGAVVLAVGLLVREWDKEIEQQNKAGEAAQKSFKKMSDGAKTFASALAGARVEASKTGIEELSKELTTKPGLLKQAWLGIKEAVHANETPLEMITRRIKEIEKASRVAGYQLRFLQTIPELRGLTSKIVQEGISEKIVDLIEKMKIQAETVGMSEVEAQKYKLVQEAIKGGFVSEAFAIEKVNLELKEYAEKFKEFSVGQLANKARELTDKTSLIHLTKEESSTMETVLEYMRKFRLEGPAGFREAAEATKGLTSAISKNVLQESIKETLESIRHLEVETRKVGKNNAEGFAIDVLEHFKQNIKEITPEVQKLIDRLISAGQHQQDELDASKLYEKTRTPLEQYTTRIAELDRLFKAGAIKTQDDYGRAVSQAAKEILGAEQAVQRFNAAASGSNDALSRISEFRDAIRFSLDPFGRGVAPGGAPIPAAVGEAVRLGGGEKQQKVLEQIRDILQKEADDRNKVGIDVAIAALGVA